MLRLWPARSSVPLVSVRFCPPAFHVASVASVTVPLALLTVISPPTTLPFWVYVWAAVPVKERGLVPPPAPAPITTFPLASMVPVLIAPAVCVKVPVVMSVSPEAMSSQ